MRLYEDPHIQQVALSHVPVEKLKKKAKEACEKSKKGGQDGVDEKDCFLLEVLRWFGMHKQFAYFFVFVEPQFNGLNPGVMYVLSSLI